MRLGTAALPLILAGATASAQTFIETFDDGVNTGGWRLHPGPPGRIMPVGGYPGAWFLGVTVDPPELRSGGRSPFTGDWTTRGDTIVALDVRTDAGPSLLESPMAIQIVTDNGTPSDATDDWCATMPGIMPPPDPGAGWLYTGFHVPVTSTMNPPPCWEFVDLGPFAPAEKAWAPLMRRVVQVRVLWSAPGLPGPAGEWIIGIDNIRIGPANVQEQCYADCTGDGRLRVHDFICFQSAYAAGAIVADCNHDTVLNVNDFICFQSAFAAGCSTP